MMGWNTKNYNSSFSSSLVIALPPVGPWKYTQLMCWIYARAVKPMGIIFVGLMTVKLLLPQQDTKTLISKKKTHYTQ